MLKQEHNRTILKPFILSHQERPSRGERPASAKSQKQHLSDTRKVIKRLVEGVKRI